MIIGLPAALEYAERNGIGLAAINTPFFEGLLGVIDVAERTDVPVILQFAQVHESIVAIEDMGPAMVELARRSSAPFVLHVDHGFDIDYIRTNATSDACLVIFTGLPEGTSVEMTATGEVKALDPVAKL